jgi:hypothetical protein
MNMLNNKFNPGLLTLLLLIVLLGVSCQNESETTQVVDPLVNPPFPEFDPEFVQFTFNTENGVLFEMPSGTEINIPPNAIVDENGHLVNGEVQLNYREMHDATSIYFAGIPMNYGNGHFETAGSFEMRVKKGKQFLRLDSTQQVDVKLASFQKGDDYDFYFLNEKARGWDSLGTSELEVNLEKVKLKKKISRMKPRLKFPLNRQYFAVNYKAILDVYYNDNLTNVNHNQAQKKMKAYGLGWNDVTLYQTIDYKGQKELAALMVWKNVSKKGFPKWTEGLTGKIENIKRNRYKLTVVSRLDTSKVFTTKIEAIMPLKALFAYGPGYWKNDYKAVMAKVDQAYEQMNQMAEVYRSFSADKFGIYNWDKLMKEENKLILSADFQFEKEAEFALGESVIVYVTGDNTGLIKYPKSRWNELALIPDPGARMFSILPGNKIALYPADKFAEIEFDDLRLMENPAYLFDMEIEEKPMESIEDLRAALKIQP